MTLTEFLEARIAEDEAVARDESRPPSLRHIVWADSSRTVAERLLAECEAKRLLVQECAAFRGVADATAGDAPLPQALAQAGVVQGLERAVAHLASVYADHPDYQPEWKPSA